MTDHKSFSFRFPRDPKTVRSARGALAGMNDGLPPARLYDASLCLAELVSNAVRHPREAGDVDLTIAMAEDRLRVEVADPGHGFEIEPPGNGREGGWGLQIVDRLADGWGIEAGERTVVWFEILRAPD